MLVFKDRSIYHKCKYTIILRQLNPLEVEIEYLDKDSCWHSNLPFDDEFKEMEEEPVKFKETLAIFSKYRKWQKRKRYTQEEFDRIFEYETSNWGAVGECFNIALQKH